MPFPILPGFAHDNATPPAVFGELAAVKCSGAYGWSSVACDHGLGPITLFARTSNEQVSRPAGHVVDQFRFVPTETTGALFHAVSVLLQYPGWLLAVFAAVH